MEITTGKVVGIDYTLTDDKQQTLDTSSGREPLTYLHGSGQIIPGLEKALNGKGVGDSLAVKVAPEDGYGARDEARVSVVPMERLKGVDKLTEGMRLASGQGQEQQIVTVTKIAADEVTLDGNHPLAGENLNFDVTVRSVRAATEEEVAHGHAHGPGGHHH